MRYKLSLNESLLFSYVQRPNKSAAADREPHHGFSGFKGPAAAPGG
jgi:hypothetical protein